MFKDDRMISFLSAIIVMVAIGTVIQRADLLGGDGGSGPLALVDDEIVIPSKELNTLDIFANDTGLSSSERESLIVLDAPSCGRILQRKDVLQYYAGDDCAGRQRLVYTLGEMDVPTTANVTIIVEKAGAASPQGGGDIIANLAPARSDETATVNNGGPEVGGADDAVAPSDDAPVEVATAPIETSAADPAVKEEDPSASTEDEKADPAAEDNAAAASTEPTETPSDAEMEEPRMARFDSDAMTPRETEGDDRAASAAGSDEAMTRSETPTDLVEAPSSEALGRAERPEIELPDREPRRLRPAPAAQPEGMDLALDDPAAGERTPLLPRGQISGQPVAPNANKADAPPVPRARPAPTRLSETQLSAPTVAERVTENAARVMPSAVAPSPSLAVIESATGPDGATAPVISRLEPDPIGTTLLRSEPRLAARSEAAATLPAVNAPPVRSVKEGAPPAPLNFQKPDIRIAPVAQGAARPGAQLPAEMGTPIEAIDSADRQKTLVGSAGSPVVRPGDILNDGRVAALALDAGGRPVVSDLYSDASEPDPVTRSAAPDEIMRLTLPAQSAVAAENATTSLLPATSRVAALVQNRAASSRTFTTVPPKSARGAGERQVGTDRPAGAFAPELLDSGLPARSPEARIAATVPTRPIDTGTRIDSGPALDQSPVDLREAPLEPGEDVAALPDAAAACTTPPATELELRNGARTMVSVIAPCHANEVAAISYSGITFAIPLDSKGQGRVLTLGFQANEEAEIVFPDKSKLRLDLPFRGIDKIERVAIIWDMPVEMELHALEFGASMGDANHVSPANPRNFSDVRRTGGGFLREYQTYRGVGQNAQIYTHWHRRGATSGVVSLQVDYVSRGREKMKGTCGNGPYASPDYMVLRSSTGRIERPTMGRLAALDCESIDKEGGDRLISGAVRDLVVEN